MTHKAPRDRFWWLAILLILAGMRETGAQETVSTNDPIACLTQLNQLPLLNRPEYASGLPVRFEGTALFANLATGLLGLRDDTTTTILNCESFGEPIHPAEKIRIEGVARMVAGRPMVRIPWLLDNDGVHGRRAKQVTLPLKAGRHSLQVDWFNEAGESLLQINWEGPGIPRQRIPDSALFHEEPNPMGGPANRVAGLTYSCYEGNWTQIPMFQGLRAVKSGVAANFDIGLVTRSNNVAIKYRGFIDMPQDGDYTFVLVSDDGSRLLIDGKGSGDGQGAVKTTGLTGPLPIPQRLFPGAVLSPNAVVQWSSVEGTVTFIDQSQGTQQLELTDGTALMRVEIGEGFQETPLLLLQSRIRVTGLCEPCLTSEGRSIAAKLLLPDHQFIELLDASPGHWSQYPLQTIGSLPTHSPRPDSVGHLKGKTRMAGGDRGFWLQDGSKEVFIQTAQALPQTNDALVEVLGLWQGGFETNRLVLGQAVYRQWVELAKNATNQSATRLPLLTKIAEIHALNRVEAEKEYPVRVRGVITDLWPGSIVVQDDTRGIFAFSVNASKSVVVGDLVEIEGVSGPGDFAPVVSAKRLTRLGQGVMPEPAQPTWDLLLNGAMDVQWVELKGVVTQIQSNHVVLLMVGGEMRVYTDLSKDDWKPFLNALVCLRGCLRARWNDRQVVAGEVAVRRLQIECIEPAPANLFDAPAKSIADMWLFSLQSSALRRIKVTGQVLRQRDRECFLQEGTNGLRFVLKEPAVFKPGARVEVAGFPDLDGPSPTLRAAVATNMGSAPLPAPVIPQPDRLLDPGWDARLVQLESRLNGVRLDKDQIVMELQTGSRMYRARMPANPATRQDLLIGSRLQMTGIYAGVGGSRNSGRDNEAFELLLNSSQDIAVLERPSWWTIQRMIAAIVVLAAVLFVVAGWVHFLRRQVQLRTRQLRDEIEEHKLTEAKLEQETELLEDEVEERKRLEVEKERIHKELMATSRLAGMSEVATGVLHNVGNILNSVNVSATLVAEKVQCSKALGITKVAALMNEHAADLGGFMTRDEKGQMLPGYLTLLADGIAQEQQDVRRELESLRGNIDHIKEIVAMQQNYARASGVVEKATVRELVEDALKMHSGAYHQYTVRLERVYAEVPPITTDKHKVLQILVNLFHNAKHACDESGRADKQVTARIVRSGKDRVRIEVADNGIGIPAENMTKIFNHGFSTRKGGHGFGLHSGSNAAKELGGSLTAHSDGPGKGATFVLELPLNRDPAERTPNHAHEGR